MKGGSEDVLGPISTVMFLALIVALILFMKNTMISLTGTLATSVQDLQALDYSHMAEICLYSHLNTKKIISEDFLTIKDGKSIEAICGSQTVKAQIEIEDKETGKKWTFPASTGRHTHSIWTPLIYTEGNLLTESDVAMESGKKYVMRSFEMKKGNAESVIIYIYPSGLYTGESYTETATDLTDLNIKLGNSIVMFDAVQPVTAGNILTAFSGFSLSSAIKDCDGSKNKQLCIKLVDKEEIHQGRLNAKI